MSPARTLLPAILIACAVALLRLVYLRWFCPYSLVEDEAQYWVWSRMLEWSYTTKGPGVALLIRGATAVLGDAEWAVRTPAVLCGLVTTVAVAGLAADMTGSSRVATLSAVGVCVIPAFLGGALLMTIDPPMTACWALAAWCAWRGLARGRPGMIVLAGVFVGLGTLCKLTMLLMVPGVVWWAWGRRARWANKPGCAPAALLAGVLVVAALLPMVVWNSRRGWPTLAHLLDHAGMAGNAGMVGNDGGAGLVLRAPELELLGPPVYLLLLAAMGGPVVVLGVWEMLDRLRGAVRSGDMDGPSYLIALALPVLIFYLLVSFTTQVEGNWPVAGFVTLAPLAAMRAVRASEVFPRGVMASSRWLWSAGVIVGVVVGVGALRLDALARIPGVGALVPVDRFMGERERGAYARTLLDGLRERTGKEPFIVTHHYGRAAALWYSTPGVERTYCASSVLPMGRRTPWDDWSQTDLRGAVSEALRGRPALAVGGDEEHWLTMFALVERARDDGRMPGDTRTRAHGPYAGRPDRPAFVCEDFRGVGAATIGP